MNDNDSLLKRLISKPVQDALADPGDRSPVLEQPIETVQLSFDTIIKAGKQAPPVRAPLPTVARWRVWLASWLNPIPVPQGGQREGKWMRFEPAGLGLGRLPMWRVVSRRGSMVMGWVEFSPQWSAYRFRAHHEAVWNLGSLAEIHAFLKEKQIESGRVL